MHEQSIVESLLALALENAEKAKASKIRRIYLVVGELSGVVEELVLLRAVGVNEHHLVSHLLGYQFL
jgi:Zn finger protein HypA/HybF involved in hydrogenase expression